MATTSTSSMPTDMYDVDDDTPHTILVHEPVSPPRAGYPREAVYAYRFKHAMACRGDALDDMFVDLSWPTVQRDASVAASVATWLGTNGGQALLDDAQGRRDALLAAGWSDGLAAAEAYISAWACANRRKGSHGGVRLLESILQDPTNPGALPSIRDHEVAEQLMFWLGCRDGQKFLSESSVEAEAVSEIERFASFCRLWVSDPAMAARRAQGLVRCAGTGEVAARELEKLMGSYPSVAFHVAAARLQRDALGTS